MRKNRKKFISAISSVFLILSLLSFSVFAFDTDSVSTGLTDYLIDADKTGFDFSETSYADSDIDWTVFTLARSKKATNYTEYKEYINKVVENSYESFHPSDLARITLTTTAYGLDAKNIGGKNLINALALTDYSAQTYLSSLSYPLLALNFVDYDISDALYQSIVSTIIAAQQSDGGFPYSTVDSGYGVYSDIDTTAMTIQALAKYYNTDSNVKLAVNKALAYIKTQQFDDGSFGYVSYSSKSGESTSQVIIALCMLNIDPTSAEYSKGENTPVSALSQFIDLTTGAAMDYSGTDNTMSTYQVLMGLDSYNRFSSGNENIYTMEIAPIVTTTEPTTVPTTDGVGVSTTDTEKATKAVKVDIPKTGSDDDIVLPIVTLLIFAGSAVVLKKKNEKD